MLLKEPVQEVMRLQPIRRTLKAMRLRSRDLHGSVQPRTRMDTRFQGLLVLTMLDL
jgi:hypothetical protein